MHLFGVSLFTLLAVLSLVSAGFVPDLLSIAKAELGDVPTTVKNKLEGVESSEAKAPSNNKCRIACLALSILLPNEHSAIGQLDYSPLPYWSIQQAEVVPACRIDVSSAKSISLVVQVASLIQCPFAVKSGGHAAFAGGSSVQDGILINLGRLNSVVLSKDRKTASIGPGQTWYDVYVRLDPLKVSVVGGREAGVGVGGLLLGGGISYFSGRYGWACDNVRNYEVVLASGKIVNASPSKNSDLYWALRGGGGSNFGIVSRFDLVAFEQDLMYGGTKFHSIQTEGALATAFENFNVAAPSDPFAHFYIAFVHVPQLGGFAGVSGPAYGKPVKNAPIFDELNQIPSLADATSIANISRLSVELNQTSYQRQLFKTVTFKNSAKLIAEITQIYKEEATSVLDIEGIFPAFAFQPISKNILQQMQKNGGNSLGLTPDRGPLMIMNMNWGWSLAKDDARVEAAASKFRDRAVALAKEMKLDDPYIYVNYASLEQPVYAGYGATNVAKLKSVKTKYDPTNVFGRLWRGYFKL